MGALCQRQAQAILALKALEEARPDVASPELCKLAGSEAGDPADREGWLAHTRGRPYHPMIQGKIERSHRSMKKVVRLENHHGPWELERAVARFVAYYHHERLHEAIGNVAPDDVYHGRQRALLSHRARIKRLTWERRKKENLRNAA